MRPRPVTTSAATGDEGETGVVVSFVPSALLYKFLPPPACTCHSHVTGPAHLRNACASCWGGTPSDPAVPGTPHEAPATFDSVGYGGGHGGGWAGNGVSPTQGSPSQSQDLSAEVLARIAERRKQAENKLKRKRESGDFASTQ
jgi:hypothetical protein